MVVMLTLVQGGTNVINAELKRWRIHSALSFWWCFRGVELQDLSRLLSGALVRSLDVDAGRTTALAAP